MTKAVSETTIDATAKVADGGLTIDRRFTSEGIHPFDEIEWEERDAIIGDPPLPPSSSAGVEFPKSWSQNATNIVAQKYFRGPLGSPRARALRQADDRPRRRHDRRLGPQGRLLRLARRRRRLRGRADPFLLHQKAAFNSPVWFNVGFEEHPQCSACFILWSTTRWSRSSAGTPRRAGSSAAAPAPGINLSNIRGSVEQLSKGGLASGPVSFMRGADAWAGTIKSGGKTRRAAKMVVLDVDHPDIEHFIWCKAKEEDKAAGAPRRRLRHVDRR